MQSESWTTIGGPSNPKEGELSWRKANDLDASASQNPNQDVANRLKDGKTIKRDPFVTAREEMMTRIDEQYSLRAKSQTRVSFSPRTPALWPWRPRWGGSPGAKRFQLTGKDASQKRRQSRQSRKESRLRQDDRGRDPLEDYIVREAGKPPMFKTVVDGKMRMIPLEAARTQLQKRLSAESTWEAGKLPEEGAGRPRSASCAHGKPP